MKLRLFLLSLLCGAIFLPAGFGQQATPRPEESGGGRGQALWRCRLPGGNYDVAVRSIVSVSSHEYIADGVARVTEVNIDTTGSVLARFYYLEPSTPKPTGVPGSESGNALIEKAQQQVSQASEKVGLDHWKKVVKNYPTTTHARTVEYRLESKEDLNRLFESVQAAFREGRPGTFTAK